MNDTSHAHSSPSPSPAWEPKYAIPSGVDVVELDRAYDLNASATDYSSIPAFDRDLLSNGYADDAANFRLDYCSVSKSETTGLSSISTGYPSTPDNWLLFHKPADLDEYSQASIWILGKHSYHATNQNLLLGIARAADVGDGAYNDNTYGSLLHVQTSQHNSTEMKVSQFSHLVSANSRTNTSLSHPYNNARYIGVLVNFTKDGGGNISAAIQARFASDENSGVSGDITNTTSLYSTTVSLGTTANGTLFYPFVGMQASSTNDQHRLLVVRTKNNGYLTVT